VKGGDRSRLKMFWELIYLKVKSFNKGRKLKNV